jgi:hypothetical protein
MPLPTSIDLIVDTYRIMGYEYALVYNLNYKLPEGAAPEVTLFGNLPSDYFDHVLTDRLNEWILGGYSGMHGNDASLIYIAAHDRKTFEDIMAHELGHAVSSILNHDHSTTEAEAVALSEVLLPLACLLIKRAFGSSLPKFGDVESASKFIRTDRPRIGSFTIDNPLSRKETHA